MKIVFCFLLTLSAAFLSAQKTVFQVCSDNTFMKMDSILDAGKDPFTAFHDCAIGKSLPWFSVKTIDGKLVDNNFIKGKILVLECFMLGCHPCIESIPDLNRLVEEYEGKNVVFLCLAFDKKEQLDRELFSKYKFNFPMVADAMPTIGLLGGGGFPKTFIVDPEGKIFQMWPGGPMGNGERTIFAVARPYIDKLLESSAHK